MPLDKILIICFKRCPYLRTLLTDIIRVVWNSGKVPAEWKKACTILVHKKGNNDGPANFRPITLESVPLKVFTSCIRDSICPIQDLSFNYRNVKFVNLSISSLGIFGKSCDSFIQMCNDLNIEKKHLNYIIIKLTTIIIRTTYYIFCMRNKPWTNPDLLTF